MPTALEPSREHAWQVKVMVGVEKGGSS